MAHTHPKNTQVPPALGLPSAAMHVQVMIWVRWIAISFVMWQQCFPHIRMFSFSHRECINLHEGRLHNKMHLHFTLKGFFVLKDFDQSQELKTIAKKSLQFYMFPT